MEGSRRYVVLGAGAVGAALGGLLHAAGARVVLIARGAHLEALRRDGLTLATPSGTSSLRIEAVASPRELVFTDRDLVLLATKSQHTVAALEDLAAAAPRSTTIVCAQNGVANEPRAKERFDHVLGAVVFMPSSFLAPGRVTLHAAPVVGGLDLGLFPEGVDAVCESVARDLSEAGFDARANPRVMRWKYGKLLTNLGNALQALVGAPALGSSLPARLEAEAIACFAAAGIDYATAEEVHARYAAVRPVEVAGAPRSGGSTWQSLARHAGSIETEFLNGEIVRLGERHGVPVPYNRALVRLAQRAVAEGWGPEHLRVEDIEAEGRVDAC